MHDEHVNIQWEYEGKPDVLLGNGATKAEQVLTWSAGLIVACLYVYYAVTGALEWSCWQYLVAVLI
ncbi:MAG: hypothetical protein ACK2UI_17150, partial [Anaerolineae bacterium]